ncbi:MAG TPA: hypothetical protein VFB03_01850 [Candidatus Saccharimonadales bacterium]|nr:hypothetical protein [Candidatus Saccharimonadales bacterium]
MPDEVSEIEGELPNPDPSRQEDLPGSSPASNDPVSDDQVADESTGKLFPGTPTAPPPESLGGNLTPVETSDKSLPDSASEQQTNSEINAGDFDAGFPVQKWIENIKAADIPNREELVRILNEELEIVAAAGKERYKGEQAQTESRERQDREAYNTALKTVVGNIAAAKFAPKRGPEQDLVFVMASTPTEIDRGFKERAMDVVLDSVTQETAKLKQPLYDLLRYEIYAMLGAPPPRDEEFRFVKKPNFRESVGEWTSDLRFKEAVEQRATSDPSIDIVEVVNSYDHMDDPFVRKLALRYKRPNSVSYSTSSDTIANPWAERMANQPAKNTAQKEAKGLTNET